MGYKPNSPLKTAIRVIHFSDIHYGCYSSNQEQARILDRAIDAIKEMVDKDEKSPDLCILSGDLTNSASSNEFSDAFEWLQKGMERLSDTKGDEKTIPVFIVPGNHDSKRLEKETLKKQIDKRNQTIELSKNQRETKIYNKCKEFVKDFDSFENFNDELERIKTEYPSLNIISEWKKEFIAIHKPIDLKAQKVHIIGLNTASLSMGNDLGKLIVDTRELTKFFSVIDRERENEDSLVLVVGHHPIIGEYPSFEEHPKYWFAQWNDKKLSNLLKQQNGAHIYFCGHTYTQTITRLLV